MGYITQKFVDNETTLMSSHLNHIESGIVQNEASIDKLQSDISNLSENISQLSANGISETLITRYEPISKSVFKGKKLWVFGDSITAGVGTDADHYFSQILCDNLGCASLKRLGNSGYAFSHGLDDYGSCILNKMDSALATAPGNCDILIICFGINDWTWGRNKAGDRAIGNLLDTTKYTICGAVNLFCQKLQTIFKDYPEVKIYFSTPTPTKNAPISGGNTGKTWDQTKKNYNGNTLRDICNAIIKTAALYGYQSLDLNLYFDGDITDVASMDIAFPDGLHPSADGNEKMAITLEKLMCANPITTFSFNPLVNTLSPLAKNLIYKEIKTIEAEIPTISLQPIGATYNQNDTAQVLSVNATVNDGGKLSYQWYKNNIAISNATNNTYTPLTDSTGSYNYYCMITNTLNGSKKSVKSTVVTITINSDLIIDDSIETVDLTSLSFNHINLPDAAEGNNLFYQQSDQTLSVDSTGWYKSSYANTPLKIGNEIELTTYFGETTGNAILIYSEDDITNPSRVASSYWPASSIFGIYASGASNEKMSIWDTQKVELSGYTADALNGGKKVKIKLLNTGVEIYINETKVIYDNPKSLVNNKQYYFGMHMNSTTTGELGAKIEYIGPIR